MSEPGSGQIVSSHLLKLVLGVVSLIALATLACTGSGDGSVSSPTAPPGMFSTLPTSEPPVLGDRPPTVELNTPEPTLTPPPLDTATPYPTSTPYPTATPRPTATPTPEPTAAPTRAQSDSDRAVLVALYHSTGGANWTLNTNWLSDRPIGEWRGVNTDSNGRVIRLDLYSNGLTGEIPPELGGLFNLTRLNLSGNQLTGEIPPELGGLSNLTHLVLHGNRLTGEIPPELDGLSNLTYLRVNSNQLTGCIPEGLRDIAHNDLASLNLPDCGIVTPTPQRVANSIAAL